MKRSMKVLLTIPSILGLGYVFTFWFPTSLSWLVPTMKSYYILTATLQALIITQLIVLIKKLWSFKNLEKSKKTDWMWILILLNLISSLVFIWKKVDEFEAADNKKPA